MKKVLLIVLACALMLIACSCNSTSTSNTTQNVQSTTPTTKAIDEDDEETTTAKKTCKDTGKHVGTGSCEECGIDYYDELVKYIKTKGVKNDSMYTITYYLKDYSEVTVNYLIDGDQISVACKKYGTINEASAIFFKKSGIKYGEFNWHGLYISDLLDIYGYLSGVFSASTVNPGMRVELDVDADSEDEKTCLSNSRYALQDLINELLPKFLEESGTNIRLVNLGFERFE